MKNFLLTILLLCSTSNAFAFCVFNLAQNRFNIRVSYDGWSSDGHYVVEPGQQFCTMEGLKIGDILHYHVYDRIEHGDYYTDYYGDYNMPSDVRMVITGYDQYWSLNTLKVVH